MTEKEVVSEIKHLLLSDDYILFDNIFFDSQIPEVISGINNMDTVNRITIWIKNKKCPPRCTLKGDGQSAGKFFFDNYKDPIIEFDLGKTSGKLISPNRLFYKTGWVDDKEVRELHTRHTSKLVRSFKKKLTTTTLLKPFYVSEAIVELLTSDYELELGAGGKRISKNSINGI